MITWPPSLKPNWCSVPVSFHCFCLRGYNECVTISCFALNLKNNTMLLRTDNLLSWGKWYRKFLQLSYACRSISLSWLYSNFAPFTRVIVPVFIEFTALPRRDLRLTSYSSNVFWRTSQYNTIQIQFKKNYLKNLVLQKYLNPIPQAAIVAQIRKC